MIDAYRRAVAQPDGSLPAGDVVEWGEGFVFQCPCDERTVYVACPPHAVEFADDGKLLTLGGSCGYRARARRPANWCHFSLVDGAVQMHSDARCPGRVNGSGGGV